MLVFCMGIGDMVWDNFIVFGDVVFQRSDIFIVDFLNVFCGEMVEFVMMEIMCYMVSFQNLLI